MITFGMERMGLFGVYYTWRRKDGFRLSFGEKVYGVMYSSSIE